jgi:hypothetical protein
MDEFRYLVKATHLPLLLDQSEAIFERAWRVDFSAPGFCVIDAGAIDSHTLRAWMVTLKERLSEIGIRRGTGSFGYCSMGRFDQQVSTKFHRDGAPAESLLMLGYEPSNVRSRLLLSDYSRVAFDLEMTPQRLLQDFNPMYKKGEELLANSITELPQPTEGHSRIVLINNSSLPFDANHPNPLGVLHKAIIETPNESERRIINSTMLAAKQSDLVSLADQRQFVDTETISPKVY